MTNEHADTVLLIDDSRAMRNIQRSVLERLGYDRVIEAGDGAEALRRCETVTPRLILVDWTMPGMGGVEFVRAYRASGRGTPIVIVTTEAERPRVAEAFRAGASAHVVKPFTPDVLRQRIEEALARGSAAA